MSNKTIESTVYSVSFLYNHEFVVKLDCRDESSAWALYEALDDAGCI